MLFELIFIQHIFNILVPEELSTSNFRQDVNFPVNNHKDMNVIAQIDPNIPVQNQFFSTRWNRKRRCFWWTNCWISCLTVN